MTKSRYWAVLPFALVLTTSAADASPQLVVAIGTDYAFRLPEHIRAGETLFAFENQGTVRHELSIAMLKDGLGVDSIITAMVAGARRRDYAEGQAALIVAAPGEPSGPRLWLDLQRGRTYLVVCGLRNTPDAPPHMTLGMITSFRAQ